MSSKILLRRHPNAPQNVTGEINDNTLNVRFNNTEESKSSLIKCEVKFSSASTPPSIIWGYTEMTNWSINLGDETLSVGDELSITVQAFSEIGKGENDAEKAEYLKTVATTGSDWSEALVLKAE